MNYPAAEQRGIKSSFRKDQRAYSNLDSRFRGNDMNAPRDGVLNPGYAIKVRVQSLILSFVRPELTAEGKPKGGPSWPKPKGHDLFFLKSFCKSLTAKSLRALRIFILSVINDDLP
jgi:hypothetical protein